MRFVVTLGCTVYRVWQSVTNMQRMLLGIWVVGTCFLVSIWSLLFKVREALIVVAVIWVGVEFGHDTALDLITQTWIN